MVRLRIYVYMYVFDTREQHNSDSAPGFLAPAWARPGGMGDSKEEAATAQHCEKSGGVAGCFWVSACRFVRGYLGIFVNIGS
jgi:hypothetical protein